MEPELMGVRQLRLLSSGNPPAVLFRVFLLAFVIPSGLLFAQGSSPTASNAYYSEKVGQYHALGGKGRHVVAGTGFQDLSEVFSSVEDFPDEEAESVKKEKQADPSLKKLRRFLRLVDGGALFLQGGEQVKVVGVNIPGFNDGKHFQSTIERAREWVDLFLRNPRKAMEDFNVASKNITHTDKQGRTFTYFYIFFPREILDKLRRDEIQKFEEKNDRGTFKKLAESRRPEPQGKGRFVHEASGAAEAVPLGETTVHILGEVSSDTTGGRSSFEDTLRTLSDYDAPVQGLDYAHKEVERVVVSTARYYYEDGTLKREETYRDNRLIQRNEFDSSGRLLYSMNYE